MGSLRGSFKSLKGNFLMRPLLHIHLLGRFLLVAGETPVTTVTVPRVQSLLAYLLLHRSAPLDRSHLAFLLWPDSTEAQAHTNLRQLLYHLRQSLPDADRFISASKQSLQWLPTQAESTFILDIQEFERACVEAEQAEQVHDITARRQALERVLHLYRGDLLPDCYEEWIVPERDRLGQMFLHAAQCLSALLEEEHDYPSAITAAHALLRQDPLHEATYRQLMRLHALCGDRAAALRAYQTCAKFLERELGIGPSDVTQAAYKSLMQSDRSVQTQTNLLPKQLMEAPLQGRKAEWQHLQKAWNTATGGIAGPQAGSPHFVILSGEAGTGKTRLAQELKVWVSRLGMMTASARCYDALKNLAYAPVTAWLCSDALQASLSTLDPTSLREIARLVPEVLATQSRLSPPGAMTEEWQRQIFFAALARAVLSARQPLLLLLDDLQWCDQETLQWLQYLFQFAQDARLLLVGTVRVEETSPSHPLVAFLGALQRDGLVTEIPLGPLTLAETTSLAEDILGSQFDPTLSNTLYHETEGNPFFVVEMIRAGTMSKGNSFSLDLHGLLPLLTQATSSLPPSVQAVLATRLAQLSAQAHDLAMVAAVIGREFSFPVLMHASGESEENVVQAIDELWQRRIVREYDAGPTNAYDFSHDKLREQIYISLSPARRRLLHQRVAEAFKAVYREDLDTVYGQIAAHYEQAGLPTHALPLYLRAGEVARQIYAHVEALHAFKRAAALLEAHLPGLAVPWETVAQVHVSLGDVFVEMGSYEEARQAYRRVMACIPAEAHFWHVRLHWKLAITWISVSTKRHDPSYGNGRQEFEEAERILMRTVNPASLDWRDEWIELQFAQLWRGRGSVDDMALAIEKARPIVEQYGTQEQRKLLVEAVGIHNAMHDRYVISADRMAAWRVTIAALEPTENEEQQGIDLTVLGIGLLCAAQFDEAEEQLCKALSVGERIGNTWIQNNCLTFLPFIFRHRGQVEELRRILVQAQSIGMALNNRIGHAAWLAWRNGDLALAETYGRESVEEGRSQQIRPNPFLWTGRWPLIGVALAKGQTSAAINDVRLLFDPTQQPPPEPLGVLLEASLQAWETGEQKKARAFLQQAVSLAEQMGYL